MTTYYVAASGSDSNTGLSPTQAWQTAAKVSGRTFLPGDVILFRRGDTWREQLQLTAQVGTADHPISVADYIGELGPAARPRFTGMEVVPTSGWTLKSSAQTTFVDDTFVRADAGAWGTATSGTDTGKTWSGTVGSFAISSNRGMLQTDFGTMQNYIGDDRTEDVEAYAEFRSVPATSALKGTGIVLRRGTGYQIRQERSTNTLYLVGSTTFATVAKTIGTDFNMRVQALTESGNVRVRARIWNNGTTEPTTWDIDWLDTVDKLLHGQYGVQATNQTAATDAYSTRFTVKSAPFTYAYTYQKTFAMTSPYNVLVEDGVLMTQRTSLADVENNAGSYYTDGTTLYVHAFDGSNPGTNGKTYEYPVRAHCIWAFGACSHLTFQELQWDGSTEEGWFGINPSANALRVVSCEAKWCSKSGVYMTGFDLYLGHCELHHNRQFSGGFINGQAGGTQCIAEWNDAHDNGTAYALDPALGHWRDHGLYIAGVDVTIRYNTAHGNTAHGLKSGNESSDRQTFHHNLSYGNGHAGGFCDSTSVGSRWYHNTFWGNQVGFFLYDSTVVVAVFEDNVVSHTLDNGIETQYGDGVHNNGGSVTLLDYNCVYDSVGSNYSGISAGAHDTNSDPLLSDVSVFDFRLRAGSPCINAGTPTPYDVSLAGTKPDMGRWEYGALELIPPVVGLASLPAVPTGTLPLTPA